MTVQKCISTIINPVADHTGSPSHPFLMAEWERLAFQHFQKVTQSRVWQKKGGNEFQSTYQYFHPTRPSSFQTTSILTVTCETVSNLLSNSINKNAVFLDQTLTLIIPRCRNPWSTLIHVYRLNSAREIVFCNHVPEQQRTPGAHCLNTDLWCNIGQILAPPTNWSPRVGLQGAAVWPQLHPFLCHFLSLGLGLHRGSTNPPAVNQGTQKTFNAVQVLSLH